MYPKYPYHERVKIYEQARKRIFCESVEIPLSNEKIFEKPKRNTTRRRKFYSKIKIKKKNLLKCINVITTKNDDLRPYLNVELFDMKIGALLDSGATISCLCGSAAQNFLSKNIPYQKRCAEVETAGGRSYKILGNVVADITFRGETKPLNIFIIPDLKQDLYLGIDFWHAFGLMNKLFVDEIYDTKLLDFLSVEQKNRLNKIISLFPNFEKEGLGKTTLLEHVIEVEKDAKPVKQRYFSISPAVEEKLHNEIDKMLTLGVIEPAPPTCSWSSPVTMVEKEGKLRLCLDSRRLNEVTIKDAYPQPKISGILSRLPKAEFISSLDLKHAFWQISLAIDSRDKTAFTVPNRPLYRYKVMPFGLTNAPQTMCRLMDIVIPAHLKSKVFVYLDDLLLVSSEFEDHILLLTEIAQVLRKAGLTLNISKCRWCQKEVKYLGYIIGNGCIKTDPDKVAAIRNLSVPKNQRQVRSFLGLAGWYRRFLDNFASLTAPLTELTKKNKPFKWTEEAQKAFDEVKYRLTSAPVLITANFEKPFIIGCDACKTGVGGVLAQEDEEGNERPIAYFSHKLNKAQQNYSITEMECLAAILSIEKFREYVECHQFRVITDHASLKWLMRQSDLNGRLARWSLRLQKFNFTIEHRKGSMHVVPDALSRLDRDEVESFDIITPLVDLSSGFFCSSEYEKLRTYIRDNQFRLPDLKVIEGFVYRRTEFSRDDEMSESSHWKLWIPQGLIVSVIENAHTPPMSSHGGIGKTLEKLRRNFYWPSMAKDVRNFILKCDLCRQTVLRPPMGAQSRSDRPFQRLYMDFLGPYPRSKTGHIGIFVVLDHFSKFPFLYPLKKFCTSAIIYYLETFIFHAYGVPETIVSDNGSQFKSVLFAQFLEKYGIKHIFTAIYCPQANSSERVNRSVITAIRSYVSKDQSNWDKHLSQICVALRSTYHTSIGHSPYFVLYGQQMMTHAESYKLLKHLKSIEEGESVVENHDRLQIIRDKVKEYLRKAYQVNQKTYNLRSRPVTFSKGDIVYRKNFTLSNKSAHYNAKLAPKYIKSKVVRKDGNYIYYVQDFDGDKLRRYHAGDLQKHAS